MTGLLIAFEGLDQSGKQTQAERRPRFRARARSRVPPGVISRLHHRYRH